MSALSNLFGGSNERTMEASQVSLQYAQSHAVYKHVVLQSRLAEMRLLLQEELQNAKISLGYRDFCAHLLIPLNACRRKELYLPWKCEHERHSYEKCEYLEYKRRLKNLKESDH